MSEARVMPTNAEETERAVMETHVAAADRGEERLEWLILLGGERRRLLRGALLGLVAGVLVALLWPASYEATTTLLAPPQATPFSSTFLQQVGTLSPALGGLGLKNPADLYVSLLKSRTVEDQMIARFHLDERYGKRSVGDTRRALEQRLEIAATAKDGIIRLTVEDTDAAMSATLANAYVEEYRKFSANLAVTEAAQRRLFLEQQVAQTKERLVMAEEALKRRQQSSGVIQLDGQTKALIESAALLRAQAAAKQVQLRALTSYETSENPEVQVARQQLAAIEGQLRELTGGGGADGELLVPKGKLPEAGLEYLRDLREVKYQETVFELLARQYESAKMDEARQGSVLQVVDRAVAADRRSGVPRSVVVFAGALLGLLVSALLVVWRGRAAWLPEEAREVAAAWGLGRHA
jgi:uncharacterized protein involved in exopolysaccharide biosynthesis